MAIVPSLSAIIIETTNFQKMTGFIAPNTLFILDVDDTLLIPTQALGTDVWFGYRMGQYLEKGESHSDALEKTLAEWEAIRHLTQVAIVEQGTETVIEQLQKTHPLMCLTTQGLALATRTLQQLESLQIDPSIAAPYKNDLYFMNGHNMSTNVQGVLYRKGILFTSGTHKGKATLKFLEMIDYHPDRIVFINDKASHLQEVEDSVKEKGIEFIGLRYSYSDERVSQFDKHLADFQWKYSTLDHLLSDQEAAEKMFINQGN